MLDRETIHRLMEEMIGYQRQKVLDIARESIPGITDEDLRNPQDFAALNGNVRFNFEDGILAGYLSVRMALLTEMNRMEEKKT